MRHFLAVLAAACFAMPALAQEAGPQCGPLKAGLQGLLSQYGEEPTFIGIAGQAPFILTLNPATHTWSILVLVPPDGSCMVMSGEGWQDAPPEMKDIAKPGQGT